jgi:hypothetical protein
MWGTVVTRSQTQQRSGQTRARIDTFVQPVRERLRYLDYCLRTEDAPLIGSGSFMRFSGMRHPRSLGHYGGSGVLVDAGLVAPGVCPRTGRR